MSKIKELLNDVTMYRLVVYILSGYAGLGVLLALFGKLAFSPTAMIVSLALLLVSAYIADRSYARIFAMPSNSESWLITALIVFLIVQPANSVATGMYLILAGATASISKFVLSWHGKHIFNPAAFAAALVSLTGLQATTWWIGSGVFWPATLALGLLVVYKIRRFPLVLTFVAASVLLQAAVLVIHHQPFGLGMKGALIASPLFFMATIMLTEPATMPPRRKQQILFAVLTAVLYVMGWKVGPIYIYPEVALLIANIYAFVVSPKFRVRLRLKSVHRISDQVYHYAFQPDRSFNFLPGQYMEWTLAGVPYDSRGNRRMLTIASSPTENDVQVGLKYYQPASAYKATFSRLKLGDSIYASQLAGNFTLDEGNGKLVFIAGGIGITPFRSMVRYLQDKGMQRDIILLYAVSKAEELAYHKEFLAAEQPIGLRYIPIVTKSGDSDPGLITAKLSHKLIAQLVPDYAERTFYVSGPDGMVDATSGYLHALDVPTTHIKTDHFSGY